MADIVIDRSDAQIKTGIEKASDLQSSASGIDNRVNLSKTPEDYGCVGDGITDDTIGLKLWLLNKNIQSSSGTYRFSEDLEVLDGTTWISQNTTLKAVDNWAGNKVFNDMLRFYSNINILGHLNFDGNGENQGIDKTNPTETGSDAGWNIYMLGMRFPQSENINIESVKILNVAGTGFSVGQNGFIPNNFKVGKIEAEGCWNAGTAIINGENVDIDSISTLNNKANAGYAQNGLDIEANGATETLRNIKIGSLFSRGDGVGLQVMQKTPDLALQGDISIGKLSLYGCDDGAVLESVANMDIGRIVSYGNLGVGFEITESIKNLTIGSALIENNDQGFLMDMSGVDLESSSNVKIGNLVAKNNTQRGFSAQPSNASYPLVGLTIDEYYTEGNSIGLIVGENVSNISLEQGESSDTISVPYGRGEVVKKTISWRKTLSFGFIGAGETASVNVTDEDLSTLDTGTVTEINSSNAAQGLILTSQPINGGVKVLCSNISASTIQADSLLTRAITKAIN